MEVVGDTNRVREWVGIRPPADEDTEATRHARRFHCRSALLRGVGWPQRQPRIRRLVRAGLTHSGKTRIAENKVAGAKDALRDAFVRICHKPACREKALRAGRAVVETAAKHCDGCGGEDNRAAIKGMLAAMQLAGQTKLLVVGGAPNPRDELKSLCGQGCELRFLTTDDKPGRRTSDSHVAWADIVVIWCSTPIDHKRRWAIRGSHVIRCPQRGVAALAQSVASHVNPRLVAGAKGHATTG